MITNKTGENGFQNENNSKKENSQPASYAGKQFNQSFEEKNDDDQKLNSEREEMVNQNSTFGESSFGRLDGPPENNANDSLNKIVEKDSASNLDRINRISTYKHDLEWDDDDLENKQSININQMNDNQDPSKKVELINIMNQNVVNEDRERDQN